MDKKDKGIDVPALEPVKKRGPGRPRKTPPVQPAPTGVMGVEITVPMSLVDNDELGYCPWRVDFRWSPTEARKMKRIVLGLQQQGVTRGPREIPIQNAADALRYILEELPEG